MSLFNKIKKLFSEKRNKAVLYSFSTSLIARMMGLLSTVIITPLLINYFTDDGFALWSILILIVGFSGFADLGMGHSLMNSLSKAKHENNYNYESKLIVTTFFFLIIVAISFLMLSLGVNYLFDWGQFFSISSKVLSLEMNLSMYLVIILFFVNVPLSIIHKIQYAWLDNHIYHFWEIIQKFLVIVFIYLCVKGELTLPYFVLSFYGPFILINIINFYVYSRKRVVLKSIYKTSLFINLIDKEIFKMILKSGMLFFIMALLFNLGRSSDNFIIGKFSSLRLVKDYEIIKKPFDLILVFIMMLSSGLWPAFGDALHAKDYSWIKKVFINSLYTVSLFSLIGVVVLMFFGNEILSVWLRGDYNYSWILLALIAGWYFLLSLNNVLSSFLGANNILKKQIYMFLGYIVIGIPLKLYGVYYFDLEGLIMFNIIAFVVTILIPSFIICWRRVESLI